MTRVDDDPALTSLETITLSDSAARALVVIAPDRGGMVTRFMVGGQSVFFLDQATLVDPTKNVRGGNPVLFPAPGPLADDRFTCDGRSGTMKQHGFARQVAWSVVASSTREATLEHRSDPTTMAQFPWAHVVRLRYALDGARLIVETRIENRSDARMPFALGFHPYFYVPDTDKPRVRLETDATRAFDNVTKQMVDVRSPIDLTVKEVDLHLKAHSGQRAVLDRGDGMRVVVSADPELRCWVVWTLAGKNFVCVEPWTAPANALNTGEDLLFVEPGQSKTLTVSIALEGQLDGPPSLR